MKLTPPLQPDQTVTDLAHLAWCALVALRLTQRDGQSLSPLMAHTFLVRWLATAQKQRLFPRNVADDIESLLRLGRQKGPAAGLQKRLEYLYESCSIPVTHQSDLLRLTYAIGALKTQGWINVTVMDDEWDIPVLLAEYDDVSALLVKKSELIRCFMEDGRLIDSVAFIVQGDHKIAYATFKEQAFRCTVITPENSSHMLLVLQPG